MLCCIVAYFAATPTTLFSSFIQKQFFPICNKIMFFYIYIFCYFCHVFFLLLLLLCCYLFIWRWNNWNNGEEWMISLSLSLSLYIYTVYIYHSLFPVCNKIIFLDFICYSLQLDFILFYFAAIPATLFLSFIWYKIIFFSYISFMLFCFIYYPLFPSSIWIKKIIKI